MSVSLYIPNIFIFESKNLEVEKTHVSSSSDKLFVWVKISGYIILSVTYELHSLVSIFYLENHFIITFSNLFDVILSQYLHLLTFFSSNVVYYGFLSINVWCVVWEIWNKSMWKVQFTLTVLSHHAISFLSLWGSTKNKKSKSL